MDAQLVLLLQLPGMSAAMEEEASHLGAAELEDSVPPRLAGRGPDWSGLSPVGTTVLLARHPSTRQPAGTG